MTKLVILSDSHNTPEAVRRNFAAEKDMTAAVYLGDGLRDIDKVAPEFAYLRIYAVAGNCDFDAMEPQDGLAAFDKVLIYYTHGHMYGVKYDLDTLAAHIASFKALGARVSVFANVGNPFVARARDVGADRIELYTGPYAESFMEGGETLAAYLADCAETARLAQAAKEGA